MDRVAVEDFVHLKASIENPKLSSEFFDPYEAAPKVEKVTVVEAVLTQEINKAEPHISTILAEIVANPIKHIPDVNEHEEIFAV